MSALRFAFNYSNLCEFKYKMYVIFSKCWRLQYPLPDVNKGYQSIDDENVTVLRTTLGWFTITSSEGAHFFFHLVKVTGLKRGSIKGNFMSTPGKLIRVTIDLCQQICIQGIHR